MKFRLLPSVHSMTHCPLNCHLSSLRPSASCTATCPSTAVHLSTTLNLLRNLLGDAKFQHNRYTFKMALQYELFESIIE
jgi:hypothetical protein